MKVNYKQARKLMVSTSAQMVGPKNTKLEMPKLVLKGMKK
jgi:hypothetical protein